MSPKRHASTFTDSPEGKQVKPPPMRQVFGFMLVGLLLLFHVLGGGQEKPNAKPANESGLDPRILQVKRICVEAFGQDSLGIQVQEMVIAKLFASKRFSLTENCERADVILKGSITERNESKSGSESEGVGFGASGSGNVHESLSSSEIRQQAVVTLRVVDREGDILWATSQESAGGKTKGAIALAAERAVRRLLRDIEKAEKQSQSIQP